MRIALLLALAACGSPTKTTTTTTTKPPSPPTSVKPVVVDTYFDTKVADPYRWLETESPETTAWTTDHDRAARTYLDKLPEIAAFRTELKTILAAPVITYARMRAANDKLFAYRRDPARQQAQLVVFDKEQFDKPTLVLDPTAGGDTHRTIDWMVPSPDGSRLAISISEGGSESGTLHVIGLDGKDIEPPIADVQRGTAGGDAAWTPDGKGLYITKYNATGAMQLWFHPIGKPPTEDRYELGNDFPAIAEILVETDRKGRVIATVQNGDGGVFRHYLRDVKGTWRQLTDWSDAIVYLGFGPTDDLWLVSQHDAPNGKVAKLGPTAKLADATVIVPETTASIVTNFYDETGLVVTSDRIYVKYQVGGPSELRAVSLAGKSANAPALPAVSSVGEVVARGDRVLVHSVGYTTPAAWRSFDPKRGTTATIGPISPKPAVDLAKYEVSRVMATSKDGTKIPLNIVRAGAPLDGTGKCLVSGYGGFDASQEPYYMQTFAPLLARGFCIVDVNLRGGGEFGEAWHRAGMLANKQNVFDDFAAALTYLATNKYASPTHIAIIGGSNGGLLMGVMLVQHPELFHAVVSIAGIYDSLRYELTENGKFNVPEYGSVTDPAQFKTLFAYSPYHNVKRANYPATLFLIGANDPRVAPWNTKKFLARLLENQAGSAPLHVRVTSTSGHGFGTDLDERIESNAAELAFIANNL